MSIKDEMTGVALLADWLGTDGSPVHDVIANMRAQRCIYGNKGNPCPLNVEPNWWGRIKSVIADWIRGELAMKSRMGLRVDGEENLGMCGACGCCLSLKVWAPKKHLHAHADLEKIKHLTPDFCWLRKELITEDL